LPSATLSAVMSRARYFAATAAEHGVKQFPGFSLEPSDLHLLDRRDPTSGIWQVEPTEQARVNTDLPALIVWLS
jgi:hypothetical protein